MPTGFTAKINDGISFEEFALTCARAFLVAMRDVPSDVSVPEVIPPNAYYEGQVQKAQRHLVRVTSLPKLTIATLAEDAYRKACQDRETYGTGKKAQGERYKEMLAKVHAWQPPSSEHMKLKEFMVDQLRQSMNWDVDGAMDYYPVPVVLSPEEWYAAELTKAQNDLEYAVIQRDNDVLRAAQATAWVRGLRESLK